MSTFDADGASHATQIDVSPLKSGPAAQLSLSRYLLWLFAYAFGAGTAVILPGALGLLIFELIVCRPDSLGGWYHEVLDMTLWFSLPAVAITGLAFLLGTATFAIVRRWPVMSTLTAAERAERSGTFVALALSIVAAFVVILDRAPLCPMLMFAAVPAVCILLGRSILHRIPPTHPLLWAAHAAALPAAVLAIAAGTVLALLLLTLGVGMAGCGT